MRFLLFVLMIFQIGCGSQKTKTVTETEVIDNTPEVNLFQDWQECYNDDILLLSTVDANGYFYAVINGKSCRPNLEVDENELIITEANSCTDLNGTYEFKVYNDLLVIFDTSEAFVFELK